MPTEDVRARGSAGYAHRLPIHLSAGVGASGVTGAAYSAADGSHSPRSISLLLHSTRRSHNEPIPLGKPLGTPLALGSVESPAAACKESDPHDTEHRDGDPHRSLFSSHFDAGAGGGCGGIGFSQVLPRRLNTN